MNNFEHRVLRIERINIAVQRSAISVCVKCTSNNCCTIKKIRDYCFRSVFVKCTSAVRVDKTIFPSVRSLLLYKGVLVRALNLHRDKKNAGENRRDMENSLVTQDSTHRGFC